ncbi:Signal-transducing histidine kinase protein [Halorhabdus tiamatea SARL4B]|uniref:histidine kinase n=1 Tax=Halorhabdus tiamatea SARL4B TaxID=1033806 RepID=U2E3Q5_9EURY|nr:Signal-transducing histidine kinase protein [Halorhabdus tiamatea SARL4B]
MDGLRRNEDRFDVLETTNPHEGIEYIEAEAIDCVVSAYELPDMDGIEFLDTVRETYPELPFVLFAGDGSAATARNAFLAGATDYLQKEALRDTSTSLSDRIMDAIDRGDRTGRRSQRSHERDHRTALFDNSPDPIIEIEFDGETPIITDVNAAFEETFGFDTADTVGQPVREVVVPEAEGAEHERLKRQVFERNSVETDVRRETTRGIREFHLRVMPIDIGDVSDGAYAWYTDITERTERERVLGELHDVTRKFARASSSEEIATLAVEAGRDILKLPYTHFYKLTDNGQKLTPMAATPEMDDRFGDLPSFDRGDGLLWKARAAGTIQRYDDVQAEDDLASNLPIRGAIIAPVGDFGVLGSASPVPAEFNAFDRELASILITQMEAALEAVQRRESLRVHEQELERQNERLDEFASVVAHDLRNPLNVATGRVELVQAESDSDHLDVIDRALDRMDALIDQTLTLAQSGQVIGETESVDLSTLSEQCWRNVETTDATLRTENAPVIDADPERLQHLFENLYRNAIEHGSDDVTVRVMRL